MLVFIGVSVVLVVALFYPVIQDYLNQETADSSMLVIAICTLAVPLTLYQELKKIWDELGTRE